VVANNEVASCTKTCLSRSRLAPNIVKLGLYENSKPTFLVAYASFRGIVYYVQKTVCRYSTQVSMHSSLETGNWRLETGKPDNISWKSVASTASLS